MLKAYRSAYAGACSAAALAGSIEASPFDKRTIRTYLNQLRESYMDVEKFNNSELADIEFAEFFMVQKRAMQLLISETETFLDQHDSALIVGAEQLSSLIIDHHGKLYERVDKYATAVGIKLDALVTA